MKKLLSSLSSILLALTGCQKAPPPPPTGPVEWVPQPLPLTPEVRKLWINVLRGTAADDIWALANVSLPQYQDRWVFHFDGTAWTNVTAQMPSRARLSIYPISKTDVWAVGTQGAAAHYDGKSWTLHPCVGTYHDFVDVYARGGQVWVAAAGPEVMHYDGSQWQKVSPPELAQSSIQVLWGTGQQVLVPVNTKDPMKYMARLRDGVWSKEPVGPGGLPLLHGSSETDIWAMSGQGQGYHYDGKTWTRFPTNSQISLWALSVAGPERAFAVGDRGTILRWDGRAWQGSESGTQAQLVSVYAPPSGPAWVGGDQLYRQK
jgi:hypothetical protein